MKFILLFLISFLAIGATFNPIPTAPTTFYGLPTLSKGALVTSNGVANGESTVCDDGEILEWDSSSPSGDGVKCVTKPTSVTLARATSTGLSWASTGTSFGLARTGTVIDAAPNTLISEFSIDVTHTGGPLKVVIAPHPSMAGTAGGSIGGASDETCLVSRNTTAGGFSYGVLGFELNGQRIFSDGQYEPFAGLRFKGAYCYYTYEVENAAAGSYQLRGYYDLSSDVAEARYYPKLQPYIIYVP